jgi:hypothetical protein
MRKSNRGPSVLAISVCALAVFCLWLGACSRSVDKQIVGKWSRLDETWAAQKTPRNLSPFEYTVTIELLEGGTYKLTNETGLPSLPYVHPEGKYQLMKSGDRESLVLDKLGIDGLNTKISGQIAPGLPKLETSAAKYALKIEGEKLTLTGDNGESIFLRVEQ